MQAMELLAQLACVSHAGHGAVVRVLVGLSKHSKQGMSGFAVLGDALDKVDYLDLQVSLVSVVLLRSAFDPWPMICVVCCDSWWRWRSSTSWSSAAGYAVPS